MITERDQQVILEVRHNVNALDPESIIPWAHNGDFTQDSKNDYEKVTEGLYLAMLAMEEMSADRPEQAERLQQIVDTLTRDRETEQLMMGVRALAREKVRGRWSHTP